MAVQIILLFFQAVYASNEASAYLFYDYGSALNFKHVFDEQNSEGINLNAGVFFQNPLSLDAGAASIESEGGELFFVQAEFPFQLGKDVLLEPYILLAKGNWEKGDFEYFYGKPDLPNAFGYGISASYGSNFFRADYIFGNAKILNNEELELFDSHFYLWNALYKYSVKDFLGLSAGIAGANAEASGALTAANQHYFLFPYSFYNAAGRLNLKTLYGIVNLKKESGVVIYALDFGAAVAFDGKLTGNMHYKYRKFYGKDEFFEKLEPVNFKNSGFVFSLISIKTKQVKIGGNYFSYGIYKPVIIPFGELFTNELSNESSQTNLTDILLWGLSVNVNLLF